MWSRGRSLWFLSQSRGCDASLLSRESCAAELPKSSCFPAAPRLLPQPFMRGLQTPASSIRYCLLYPYILKSHPHSPLSPHTERVPGLPTILLHQPLQPSVYLMVDSIPPPTIIHSQLLPIWPMASPLSPHPQDSGLPSIYRSFEPSCSPSWSASLIPPLLSCQLPSIHHRFQCIWRLGLCSCHFDRRLRLNQGISVRVV